MGTEEGKGTHTKHLLMGQHLTCKNVGLLTALQVAFRQIKTRSVRVNQLVPRHRAARAAEPRLVKFLNSGFSSIASYELQGNDIYYLQKRDGG